MKPEPFMASGTKGDDLRILMLEDSPTDAELNAVQLKEAGLAFTSRRIDTREAFVKELDTFVPDLILADYTLPGFDGRSALQIAQAKFPDVPFIFVSGTLGEETAVESLKLGATDYVLKHNLKRLGPVVKRALREANERLQRKQAEQALRASEERFRALIEQGSDIVAIVDSDTTLRYIAPSVERVLGYSPAELVGKSGLAFVEPEDVQYAIAALVQLREQPVTPAPIEVHVRHKNGYVRIVEVLGRNLLDNPGVQGIAIDFHDITERKQAETALNQERNLLSTLIDNLPDAVYVKDPQGRIVLDNVQNRYNLGGLTKPEETLGKTDFDFHPRALAEQFYADEQAILRSGQPLIDHEEVNIDAQGNRGWDLTTKVPVRDQSGKITAIVGISRDISERKRAEEELRRSEAAEREQRILAETLASVTLALTSQLGLEGVFDEILRQAQRLIPNSASQIALLNGKTIRPMRWQGYERFDSETFVAQQVQALADSPLDMETVQLRKPVVVADTQANPHWIIFEETAWIRSAIIAPICLYDTVLGTLELDSDVPNRFTAHDAARLQPLTAAAAIALENAQLYDELQRHAAELERRVELRTAELFQAKEHLETILNSSTDAIVVVGRDGLVQQKNPAFSSLFGYESDEAIGLPIMTLAAPDSFDAFTGVLRAVLAQAEPRQIELIAQRKEGTRFDADLVLSPIVGPGKQTLEVVCSARDITTRKQMEIGLRQMVDKERELGELRSRFVSMASHDFRTPLAVILSSASMLKLYNDKMAAEARLKHFDRIQIAVKQMTDLLDDVLTFAQGQEGRLDFKPVLVDLEGLCREMLEETQIASGETHEFVFSKTGHCADALIDTKLLRQIVNNLLSNAVKYSPEGSLVLFDLSCEPGRAVLRVQDHGLGIPEQDQARLFEPFHRAGNVTTVRGTGLGLAIVKKAVNLHGGTIGFESQVGVGTTFTVAIPTSQETRL